MAYSSSRDNWERLVAAVVKREQIWQLCHQDSITTIASDYSDATISLSSNNVRLASSPSRNDSIVEDSKNASKTITRSLFSALRWKRKPKDYHPVQHLVGIPEYDGLKSFSLRELLVATGKFSNENVIGRGAHGTVYKGRLTDGFVVAVKRLQQQVIGIELELATHVAHRNVVKLLGFCITQEEQLLVYPFMKNGSVASCLREKPETQVPLGWPVRRTIALGVATGLCYLHQECIRGIIHRDVKAANILLDEDFQAVLADFTLATFMDHDDGAVKGTMGHIAPEYLFTGKCSEKSDVFSYGIFLLELITGHTIPYLRQFAKDREMELLECVFELCKKGNFDVMVDSHLEGYYIAEEVEMLFQIALICSQNDPDERPEMLDVVRMIDGLDGRWKDSWKECLFDILGYKSNSEWNQWFIVDSLDNIRPDELSNPR